MSARGIVGACALLLAACGAAQSGVSGELHCSGGSGEAQRECEARGCSYGPTMWCGGVAPSEEWEERSERGELSCACTCQADVDRCSTLP